MTTLPRLPCVRAPISSRVLVVLAAAAVVFGAVPAARGSVTTPPGSPARAPADVQPTLPLRAAFYYPWYPQHWRQRGFSPYSWYEPVLGWYDSSDAATIRRHVAAMEYGNIGAGIASWWGRGTPTDGRIPALLSATAGSAFRWAVYYEREGSANPSVSEITTDLTYLRDRYGGDPSYLRIDGRFVVFVYGGSETCAMADRWRRANTVGAFVVLKILNGYRTCASQPDGWHQYSPSRPADGQRGYSYSISPGFWYRPDPLPRLQRDLSRWYQNVRDMVASAAPFQLVTTFNEWGEGPSVEAAAEWASPSGYGAYLDALHTNGTGEPQPQLRIGDVAVNEGNTNAAFRVVLSRASAETVTVSYRTTAGTALPPGDYGSKTGTLTFRPGDTSETVSVGVKADAVDEPREAFSVVLSRAANAAIADGHGVATIRDCSIVGTAGNDVLIGTAGNDVICGFGGNDALDGRGGSDTLRGGPGTDRVSYVVAPNGVAVNLSTSSAAGWGWDRLAAIEAVVGSRFNDLLIGNAVGNDLWGGAGNDDVDGRAGNDRLLGQDGNDRLNGNAGSDSLNGGNGNDLVTYAGAPGGAGVSLPGGGSSGAWGNDRLGLVEHVVGTRYGDRIAGNGYGNGIWAGGGNDVVWGNGGNDAISGDAGADALQGNDGHDRLSGGTEPDWLYGQTGNDTLHGGNGLRPDSLSGGTGTDACWSGSGALDFRYSCEIR
jgi:Ca2+-binding RTX toxin-like protein